MVLTKEEGEKELQTSYIHVSKCTHTHTHTQAQIFVGSNGAMCIFKHIKGLKGTWRN